MRSRADAHRKQASGATRRILQRMIVLGIDPGLANTGYGVVARDGAHLAALDGGVIETRAGVPQERRLADIHAAIDALLAEHEPDVVALEELYFGQNVRTAFAVGHARGAVMLAAGQRGVPCASYTPQKVNLPEAPEVLGQTRTQPNAHMRDFLECIRTGREPNCPFELGFRVSIACRMAVESYRQGRAVRWDPVSDEIA